MSQAKLVMLLGFWREKDRLYDVTVLFLLIGCPGHSDIWFGIKCTFSFCFVDKVSTHCAAMRSWYSQQFSYHNLCKAALAECPDLGVLIEKVNSIDVSPLTFIDKSCLFTDIRWSRNIASDGQSVSWDCSLSDLSSRTLHPRPDRPTQAPPQVPGQSGQHPVLQGCSVRE